MIGALVAGITGAGGASLSSYESIATATGTGSSGTITFSSIPSGFKHLQIRGMAYDGGGNNVTLRCNADSGSNYAWHRLYGTGSAAAATGSATQTSMDMLGFAGYTTNCMNVMVIDILDYASTSKYKTVRAFVGYDENSTGGRIWINSGLWMSTSAITSISLVEAGNFNTQSTFALYGIKEA